MALLLDSDGQQLLHMADAAHHPMQIAHPDWSPAFDKQPDVSAQTRRDLFERIADEQWLMMAYHFQFPALGHITRQADTWCWEAVKPD
jgi:glyoxylase-like metal-dependent hydrolase (beta-lactamase superfamily II)